MAHSNQAQKRIRQNEKRRLHNKHIASIMRSKVKAVVSATEAGDKTAAEAALPSAFKQLDKAAKHRVVHPKTADRKKSRLTLAIQRIGSSDS